MRFSSSLLSLILLSLLDEGTAQRLVIFAGPRKTSDFTEEFLYTGYHDYPHGPAAATYGFPREQVFKHWIWPQIHTVRDRLPTAPHQIYGHLVAISEDVDLQGKILSELKDQFDQAKSVNGDNFHGMIIGSEEFDRVGPNPYSQDDAVSAVKRLVETLGLTPSNVTMVLLYRVPRLDQWVRIFETINFDHGEKSYKNLLCDPKYMQTTAWDALQNSMNPLRVALIYASQGFNVKLMDMTGMEKEGLDVENAIGCRILNAECDSEGFLVNMRDESYLIDASCCIHTDFAELSAKQEADLENLFLLRDCAYDFVRKGMANRISWEYQVNTGLFENGCTDRLIEIAKMLVDTDYFINVLQSQVDCNEDPVSIESILQSADIASTPSPTDAPSWPQGETIPDERDSIVVPPYQPSKGSPSQASTSANDGESAKKSPLFFLSILSMGGIAFVMWRRGPTKKRHPLDFVDPPEFECQLLLKESVRRDSTTAFDTQ